MNVMKYLSSDLLDDLYQQTESNISRAISEWQLLSGDQMNRQPGQGQWSAAQCLEHLNSYGRYYLPAIGKATREGTNRPALYFNSGWLGNYFYRSMLTGSDGQPKKKMSSPKDHRPIPQLDAPKVLNEFISQMEFLGKLLTDARNVDINLSRVPISIAPFIKLKLGDVFLFLVAHINRHMLQAERALSQAATLRTIGGGRHYSALAGI
jgi:DinB superfamily